MQQRRKSDFKKYSADATVLGKHRKQVMRPAFTDYPKFIFYCMLLVVPLYAIVISIINRDWIMMALDILLLPIGFIHGIFLLFGLVN